MTTNKNINEVMAELKNYMDMKDELQAEIEALQDQVKSYMTEAGVDEVIGENGEKATWRNVVSNRFDSTAFKKSEWGELYKDFVKRSEYMRFTFNR